MASSSLEELLAEEGFRGRRSGMALRASFRADAVIKSLYPSRDKPKSDSPLGRRMKTERTRFDLSRYISRGESPRRDITSSRRPRDNLASREKIDGRSKIDSAERLGRRDSNDVQNDKTHNSGEIEGSEITEVGAEGHEGVKDIYSVKAYNSERSEKSSQGNEESHRYLSRRGNNVIVDERHSRNSSKSLLKYTAFEDSSINPSYDSSVRSSKIVKRVKDDERTRCETASQAVSDIALDKVAVKAMVSILNGYIKRFLRDEEFRTTLRHNCFSSLMFNGEGDSIKSKVITNLEQAIETVEKATEEAASTKDLKRAALQLSVITSLNSNDLEDGHTSGIPNFRLSACAHLYRSVIYKLQKKDRASSKYLLQVFCDSPFSARTILLPELWDFLFFPHLSHMKEWYNQEADSLLNTPSKIKKLELLDKVYNETLDSGTYQFAVYYKDWLTEGIEAPSLPTLHIPKMSVQEVEQLNPKDHSSGLSRPSDPFSPQPMVSKKLYEAVFSHSSRPVSYEAEDGEADNLDNVATISDGSAYEVKQTIMDSPEIVKYLDQDTENGSFKDAQDNTCLYHNGLTSEKEEWKLPKMSPPPESDCNYEIRSSNRQEERAGDDAMLNAFSHTKANESILMSLAKSVIELQQTDDSGVIYSKQTNVVTSCEELDGTYQYFDDGSFLASVPQDFICPLSGQIFENPVTLETGQTFEQQAIREWFSMGNRTCPVTGKTLECPTVPFTNFILKRVISNWKLGHCSRLLALASQIFMNSGKDESRQRDEKAIFILEKLLTSFGREERLANAKHLVSLGGLEFLIRRIRFGELEEKIRVAALLSCCIEADASCRNHIIKRIDKWGLLELLHSKQPKSRRNAVLLLTELLCLSRRKDVKLFLSGLQNEELMNAMHILLMYLQNSPPEQRPWVAVLLLHLDPLVEHHKFSIYREEAVDAIVMALESSLTDEKVCEKTCRALLALGGRFSASGKSLTESWVLKQAGFNKIYELNSHEEDSLCDDSFSLEGEEETTNEWLRNLSASLLGNGKKSFLEAISKCLASGNLNLIEACLATIAWLSSALSALSDAEFHLSAFSALISGLKESLENGEQIELKVLASMSLINFSKIPECRVLLMTIAEEIAVPLRALLK
ncbi:putative E3 ubiquitin-protein ligase LIN-1 [Ricinus communis]|uniref:putative E3 ubiquitin-protein ligase LIN-1 n=1 Tax=Ricinus communis TaxID=3988 RepID=UPI00201AA33B|nr:putative E3 ubiquitin-protein ligase LIN-1 [Ricinus communis]